jgi:hypothetical protein
MLGPEQRPAPLDGEIFDFIGIDTAGVKPLAWITFYRLGVENGSERFQYGNRRVVFGRDKVQRVFKTPLLCGYQLRDFGINLIYPGHQEPPSRFITNRVIEVTL